MNLSFFKKISTTFLLTIILIGSLPVLSYADDNQDKSVSDWFGKDNDSGQDIQDMPKEVEKDEPAADQTQEGAAVGLSGWDYAKTLLALAFVVGLLLALLKFINRKNRIFDQHRLMKNVGGLSLGQQKSIQLVVIGESYYLIGVGDEVRLLKEITSPDEIEALESYFDEDELKPQPNLVNKLMAMLPLGKENAQEESNQSGDFKKMFTLRLDELKAERKKHLNRLTEKESRKDE